LPDKPLIADIGCGKGVQTIDLARQTNGQITAVDIHQPFLDSLEQRAAELNLTNHIRILQADMNALPFSPESLDLIWAEGSIFITGFENGLKNWRRFLKPEVLSLFRNRFGFQTMLRIKSGIIGMKFIRYSDHRSKPGVDWGMWI
jgi:ubiquinone/menaquinone biosynthesis C-methylase UbiE